MSDIVERLRAHKVPQMHEAADTIATLRSEVEQLHKDNTDLIEIYSATTTAFHVVKAAETTLRATNERLRAALRMRHTATPDNPEAWAEACIITEAALAEEKKG